MTLTYDWPSILEKSLITVQPFDFNELRRLTGQPAVMLFFGTDGRFKTSAGILGATNQTITLNRISYTDRRVTTKRVLVILVLPTGLGDRIYRIEHPKSTTDIQKIYEGINNKFPDMDLDLSNGEKSYLASVFLQDFRRSLLTGKKLEQNLHYIHKQIRMDISGLVKESALFRVENCFKVRLKKDVIQFMTLNNYKDYVKTDFT